MLKPWAHTEPWRLFDSREPEGRSFNMQKGFHITDIHLQSRWTPFSRGTNPFLIEVEESRVIHLWESEDEAPQASLLVLSLVHLRDNLARVLSMTGNKTYFPHAASLFRGTRVTVN